MIAKTFEGLEQALAGELKELGAENIEILKRAVAFEGDTKLMYMANYWLRSAINILKPIASFEVENEQDLYDKIYQIKWLNYFDLGKTFAIHAVINNHPVINHSQYAARKAKDAIADQFRYYFNQRPDVDPKNANINISIHISGKKCEVALNSSGMPLFKRGYKVEMHRAPLNEVLAAGMILLSGWDKKSHFIDPMCGSGTLLIEAALMAYNFPPQFMRKSFNFEYWSDFEPGIWREIKREAVSKQVDFENRIIGGDISSKNLDIARHLITNMKFHKDIELKQVDIRDHYPPDDGQAGWIVTNPPYGERLHSKDLLGLYEKIGTAFKHNFPGYRASVISSDMDAMKMIGLKPARKQALYNGGLLCTFNTYELYEGSKKAKKETVADVVPENNPAEQEETPEYLTNLFTDGSEMKDYDPLAFEEEQKARAQKHDEMRKKRKEEWKNKKEESAGKKKEERKERKEGREERQDYDTRKGKSGFKRELGKDFYNSRKSSRKKPFRKNKEEYGETKGNDWKAKRYDKFKKRMKKAEEDKAKPETDSKYENKKYKNGNAGKGKKYTGKKGR